MAQEAAGRDVVCRILEEDGIHCLIGVSTEYKIEDFQRKVLFPYVQSPDDARSVFCTLPPFLSEEMPQQEHSAGKMQHSPKRRRILVVDDEDGFTRLLKRAAKHHKIMAVNDAMDAVVAATRFRPDLILLDRLMADISGESLAIQFKAHPQLNHIPIAFVTALLPRDDEGLFRAHLHDCPILEKPVSIQQIDQLVSERT